MLSLAAGGLLGGTLALPANAAPTALLPSPANARATITLSTVAGATSYNLYRSTTEGGPYGAEIAAGLATAASPDATAAHDTTYYHVATAVCATGGSGSSSEDSAALRAGMFAGGVIAGDTPFATTWTVVGSPYVVLSTVEVRKTILRGTGTGRLFVSDGTALPRVGEGEQTAFAMCWLALPWAAGWWVPDEAKAGLDEPRQESRLW